MLPSRLALRIAALLLLALATPLAFAQFDSTTQWRSGLSEINEGWATHDGDDLRWAQANFQDSAWQQVDIEDIGPAQPGWRWFRKRISLGPDHASVHLLISGGDGTYELYVNDMRVNGPSLRSPFAVSRPVERVFPLPDDAAIYTLALRTRTPANYAYLHFPLFLSATLGGPTAIDYERQALESQRLYRAIPSAALNLLLCLAGIGSFGLFAYQRTHREYLFLGFFLLLTGLSDGLVICQESGLAPNSFNLIFGDPLTYFFSIAQIEFTFAFAGRRVARLWRLYEGLLLSMLVLVVLGWNGRISYATYDIAEAAITAPMALTLPLLLFVWWRRGNREAGLLIFPSLLPAAAGIVFGLGTAAIYLHWTALQFLADSIFIGPVPIALFDIGAITFLLAIAVVMFFRFTRVSREQARAAAELNAAREIQQRLVPASLPTVPGFIIETAYLPAQEVGGDFYQILAQPDGSTLVVVGDVSGKGLKAAMTGALAIGAIRTLCSDCPDPAGFLARLNQQLIQSQESGFVTCLCAHIHACGEIVFSNAGHLAPYLNGEEIPVESGLPLGITSTAQFSASSLQLEPEDTLVLLSDGVLEARNPAGELFGFERTRALSVQSAQQIAAAAQAFGQEDDITVLTLRFGPAPVLPS